MPIPIDVTPILALTDEEKGELIELIEGSMTPEAVEPRELPDEVKAMLEQRLQDARDNPDDVVTWEEVVQRLQARRQQ